MKKSILFVALVAVFVLSFATAAFAIGPFFNSAYNNSMYSVAGGTGTYLDWDGNSNFGGAVTLPGNTGTSPHGGYAANTNKCAVCHAVHTAEVGGSVLTAGGPYATYSQGCVFCHAVGNTFTDVVMTANADGYISPHGTCTRCHALNPHGVGTSVHVVLASKLLNTNADTYITNDFGSNGITAVNFNGTGTAAESALGGTLGTGYLCGSCHEQGFAVNTPGFNPAGGGAFTGHRVTAMATANWQATFGADVAYTGNTVAYKDAGTCTGCHDATIAGGAPAFPHGYVDAAGALSPKTVAGSSYIWLKTGTDALAATTLLAGTGNGTTTTPGSDAVNLLTEDGLCLKCHRSGTGSGVGLTF